MKKKNKITNLSPDEDNFEKIFKNINANNYNTEEVVSNRMEDSNEKSNDASNLNDQTNEEMKDFFKNKPKKLEDLMFYKYVNRLKGKRDSVDEEEFEMNRII